MVQPIPEGFNTLTPVLVLKDCDKMIDTYKKALGAKELDKMMCPMTGKVMHAVLQIGDSKIMVSDEFEGCPASDTKGTGLFLYVKDCDATMKQAKDAGLKEQMPTEDMFWGDRMGSVMDACGVRWSIATHVKDLSEDEIKKAAKEWAEKMQKNSGKKAA